MRALWTLAAVALVLVAAAGQADDSILHMNPEETFETPEQLERYERLTHEFRCVVCMNQSVAESNVDLARDLRRITRDMILAGNTDDEIKQFMTDRYGDFVLYNPPLKPITYLLWGAPVILLLGGAAVVITVVGRRAHESGDDPDGMGENS